MEMIINIYLVIAAITGATIHLYVSSRTKNWSILASIGAGITWPIPLGIVLFEMIKNIKSKESHERS